MILPDDVVELSAKALAAVASQHGTLCEGEQPEDNWEAWIDEARAALEAARYGELVEAVADFRSAVMAPADAETIDKADKRLSALLSTIGEPTDIGGV